MTNKLNQCPKCGGEMILSEIKEMYFVICVPCQHKGKHLWLTAQEAIDEWNGKLPPTPLNGDIIERMARSLCITDGCTTPRCKHSGVSGCKTDCPDWNRWADKSKAALAASGLLEGVKELEDLVKHHYRKCTKFAKRNHQLSERNGKLRNKLKERICDGIMLTRGPNGRCEVFLLFGEDKINVISDNGEIISHIVEGEHVQELIEKQLPKPTTKSEV